LKYKLRVRLPFVDSRNAHLNLPHGVPHQKYRPKNAQLGLEWIWDFGRTTLEGAPELC